jgi:hypothetical protein
MPEIHDGPAFLAAQGRSCRGIWKIGHPHKSYGSDHPIQLRPPCALTLTDAPIPAYNSSVAPTAARIDPDERRFCRNRCLALRTMPKGVLGDNTHCQRIPVRSHSVDANAARKVRWVTYTTLLAALAASLWLSIDQSQNPVGETTGIVQGVGVTSSDNHQPSMKLASIQLSNGTMTLARVPSSINPAPGQKVRLHVYRQIFTGVETYRLVGIESRQ